MNIENSMKIVNLLKKTVVILLCACMLPSFASCNTGDKSETGGKETANTASFATEATEPEETIGSEPIGVTATALESDDELVLALVKHLHMINAEYAMPDNRMKDRIDKIKNGADPLLVSFAESEIFYVCGYYNTTDENEAYDYYHRNEYVWVKYENAADIQEYYQNIPLVVSFQINIPGTVIDVLKNNDAPRFEHLQIYTPVFENGANVSEIADVENACFVYLNESDKETIYYSSTVAYHDYVTFACGMFYEKYYIWFFTNSINADGYYQFDKQEVEENLKREFGEYYDILKDHIIADYRNKANEQNGFDFYSLLGVNAFAEELSNAIAKDRLLIELGKTFNFDPYRETKEFTLDIYMGDPAISEILYYYVTVSNGEIYSGRYTDNLILHDTVIITQNLDVVYEKYVYPAFESRARLGFFENPEELRIALETIDNSKGCYLLLKSETNIRMGVFKIGGKYYLVNLLSRFGDVPSIIGGLKEKK